MHAGLTPGQVLSSTRLPGTGDEHLSFVAVSSWKKFATCWQKLQDMVARLIVIGTKL